MVVQIRKSEEEAETGTGLEAETFPVLSNILS